MRYPKLSSLKKACRFGQTFLNLNKIETLMTASKIVFGFVASINLLLSYGQLYLMSDFTARRNSCCWSINTLCAAFSK